MYQKSERHIENALKASQKSRTLIHNCIYCNQKRTKANIKRHTHSCYLNPTNLKKCEICNNPIKNFKTSKTCSYSCANKKFRTGKNNGNWKEEQYRTTCFEHHEKKCIVCSEENIVAVHHLDENKKNNNPNNLIPLCPTHHQYWHSKYKHLIEKTVLDYIKKWSSEQDLNLHDTLAPNEVA